jgi:hypothetical protein
LSAKRRGTEGDAVAAAAAVQPGRGAASHRFITVSIVARNSW